MTAKSNMIISDERGTGHEGICEQCHETTTVRTVDSVGHGKEYRGSFLICFQCFGPRVKWRPRGKHAGVYTSPATRPGDRRP